MVAPHRRRWRNEGRGSKESGDEVPPREGEAGRRDLLALGDADLYEWLGTQPSKAGTIKRLLREEMGRSAE